MLTTDQQLTVLEEAIDQMENYPAAHNQQVWISRGDDRWPPNPTPYEVSTLPKWGHEFECGTTLCAAGWLVHTAINNGLAATENLPPDIAQAAISLFNPPPNELYTIFYTQDPEHALQLLNTYANRIAGLD